MREKARVYVNLAEYSAKVKSACTFLEGLSMYIAIPFRGLLNV